MPRGFLTEDGPHPEFADQYGAAELPADSVRDRTEQNVLATDATLWFGVTTTLRQATVGACHRFAKPCMPVYPGALFEPCHVATWIAENKIGTLNVAGNASKDPGSGIEWNASSAKSCNSSATNGPDPAATIAAHGKTFHPAD